MGGEGQQQQKHPSNSAEDPGGLKEGKTSISGGFSFS